MDGGLSLFVSCNPHSLLLDAMLPPAGLYDDLYLQDAEQRSKVVGLTCCPFSRAPTAPNWVSYPTGDALPALRDEQGARAGGESGSLPQGKLK